jgi:protein phosphatase 2C family protein 2/3
MRINSFSTKGRRTENEDRLTIMKKVDITLCGIYDGHAGAEVSTFLKNHFGKMLLEKGKESFQVSSIKNICQKVSKRLNTYLKKYNIDSGSTALVAMFRGRDVILANVGDCRGIISRDGLAIQLTKDHKPGFVEEKARISHMGGRIEYDRNIDAHRIQGMSVSRSFGDLDVTYVSDNPDIHRFKLQNDDAFVVLASDGLWDALTNQQVVEFLLEHGCSKTSLRSLAKYAVEKGSRDNITIIAVDFSENKKRVTKTKK